MRCSGDASAMTRRAGDEGACPVICSGRGAGFRFLCPIWTAFSNFERYEREDTAVASVVGVPGRGDSGRSGGGRPGRGGGAPGGGSAGSSSGEPAEFGPPDLVRPGRRRDRVQPGGAGGRQPSPRGTAEAGRHVVLAPGLPE